MSNQEKKPTRSRDFDAEVILGPDATIGDKLKALRLSKKITLAALSRSSGLSDRAIRYIENNERQPGIDAIKAALRPSEDGSGYYYFGHHDDGTPYYSRTLSEHEYQRDHG